MSDTTEAQLELERLMRGERVPLTAAGRMEFLNAMMCPVYVETCPHCGAEREVDGPPFIDRDTALALMKMGEPEHE